MSRMTMLADRSKTEKSQLNRRVMHVLVAGYITHNLKYVAWGQK
jgi:hypothetical protein